jgi:hypothetical protein
MHVYLAKMIAEPRLSDKHHPPGLHFLLICWYIHAMVTCLRTTLASICYYDDPIILSTELTSCSYSPQTSFCNISSEEVGKLQTSCFVEPQGSKIYICEYTVLQLHIVHWEYI